jgi:hypothetical protein
MPPDFLLRCTRCGSEAVWDSEEVPPVGAPEIGDPVLWYCRQCEEEMRHTIADLFVPIDKLHHEISLVTEVERATVDRVMTEVYRHRRPGRYAPRTDGPGPAADVERVAEACEVSMETVERIAVAEADWMLRRGYLADRSREE